MTEKNGGRPLSGIRVLGLEQYVAGPYCTMLLADAGAEVIKVEPPGKGDPRRSLPPFVQNEEGERSSGGFMRFNRSKKSVTLDLKQEHGKEILRELIRKADVVVENFKPGTVERLGFGYNEMRQINPAIIYASLSGFGKMESHRGPYWERPGFDIVFQAMGGLMHNVGDKDGPPTFLGIFLADLYTPLVTAYAIMLALRVRERTGVGQFVDIALYDCMTALNEGAVVVHSYTGEIPGRDQPRIQEPLCAFKTRDGYVALMIPTEDVWARFCRALGKEEWTHHPQLCSGVLRARNFDDLLRPFLDEWIGRQTNEEVVQFLLSHGVPVGPSQTAADLVRCPQLAARNMILEIDDGVGGKRKVVGSPVKMSGIPEIEPLPPPLLGQHNEEIYKGLLGFGEEKLSSLRELKVI